MTMTDGPAEVVVENWGEIPQEDSETPSRQDQLKALAGDAPLLMEPEFTTITLPRGLYLDGIWETEVEIHELTGADEEALARYKPGYDNLNAIVMLGMARVGPLQLSDLSYAERFPFVDQLLTGEWQMMLISIAAASFGSEQELAGNCQHCEKPIEFTLNLMEDLKPTIPAGVTEPLHTYKAKDGSTLYWRLATAADQRAALAKPNSAEQFTTLLGRILAKVDDKTVMDGESIAKKLSMKDRAGLRAVINEHQPQVDMQIELNCPTCNEKNLFDLRWDDLFR